MTTVAAIDTVANFLRQNVCCNLQFLQPDKKDAKDYVEKYVNPEVFAFFEPADNRKPPNIETTTPCVVVQLQQGTDDVSSDSSIYNFVLAFSIWRPGEYQRIIETEHELNELSEAGGKIQYQYSAEREFTRNEDGWRDVYNFLDEAKRALIRSGKLGNLVLKENAPIKYGPYTKDGALADFYPYWHAWLSFTAETIVTPVLREIEEYL